MLPKLALMPMSLSSFIFLCFPWSALSPSQLSSHMTLFLITQLLVLAAQMLDMKLHYHFQFK